MSEKKLTQLPSDEDWDDDNGPFVEAESHLVRVASKRERSSKRCCLFVIPTFIVIALLVLGAVITGVVLSTSRSGSRGGTNTGNETGTGGGTGSGGGTGDNLTISFHINTTLLSHSGDWVMVTWENVDSPSPEDWIGVYSPPISGTVDSKNHAPIKWQYAKHSPTHLSEGKGSLQFRLVNMRADVSMVFLRGGLYDSVVMAVSEILHFKYPNEPLQGHLALTEDPTTMILQWVSLNASEPVVKWGSIPGQLTHAKHATSSTYNASDMCGSPATDFGYRDPGMLHQVMLDGLTPGAQYYYVFGDSVDGLMSDLYSFRAAPQTGPDVTVRVVAYGDMGNGQPDDSRQVEHPGQQPALNTTRLVLNQIDQTDLVLHIGDISYARGYASVWDEFFDLIQPVAARVPYMVCIGNHERDWPDSGSYYQGHDSGGECGVPHERRFPMPRPSLDEAWYGFDYGSVHFVLMSTEHNFTQGSPQYKFLDQHMQGVNRSKTPWLIFAGHRPMYIDSSNNYQPSGDLPVAELLRESVEPLLMRHEVDLALWGHHHSYQRTCPVYQENCIEGATTHIVIGMGGQIRSTNVHTDRLQYSYAICDQHYCRNGKGLACETNLPLKKGTSWQDIGLENNVWNGPGYAEAMKHSKKMSPPAKPVWIEELDDQHWGYSRFTVNATALVFEYVRNEDGQVHDTLVLKK